MTTFGPSRIDIVPWTFKDSAISTPTRIQGSGLLGGGVLYPTAAGAVNCSVGWEVPLVAGTWKLDMIYVRESNNGIQSFFLDAGLVGSIDTYGTWAGNSVGTISNIVVATSGIKALGFSNIFKNNGSSGYSYQIQHITMTRTA